MRRIGRSGIAALVLALVLVLALAMAGLARAGGETVHFEHERPEFRVVIHFADQWDTLHACNARHVWGSRVLRDVPEGMAAGCNAFDAYRNLCEIWVERPSEVDDRAMRTLGHELMHCYAGHFHS